MNTPELDWWGRIAPFIGVAVGLLIGEGLHFIRGRLRVKRLKRALRAECDTLVAQIPFLIDIIEQIIDHLGRNKILSGQAVRSVSSIYKSTLEELGPELEPKERNLLHVVYERLRVGDERLENFERDIRRDLAEDLVADPFAAHAGLLRDLIQSYNVVSNLLKSYLEGRPEDVFPISKVLASPGA